MLYLDPIIDNKKTNLADAFQKATRESEEARISTGYFYVSGFNLVKDDLDNLADPEELGRSPLRILMGATKTDALTRDEIEEGKTLRERLAESVEEDIEQLNNAQIQRLDSLRDFIAQDLVEVRVNDPEDGIFHSKGACFRGSADEEDNRPAVTIVGSSNFSWSGHTQNIELNLATQDIHQAEAFEAWFDGQWANSEEFSEDLVEIIESNERYQEWKEEREKETEESDEVFEGTYLEPFETYKLLAYDALDGNIAERANNPLYHFQHIGYESAREKLGSYDGCIISDSVGLGKSFIGGELLFEYRQRNENCLCIVPANLVDQWTTLLEEDTDETGDPYFNIEVDGRHLEVLSLGKFQNLDPEEVRELDEQFDVFLIDEAHRFRNHGSWNPNPSHSDDYKGTRRHANLRLLRGNTMIMLTATPINNSVEDLENLISLFTDANEILNKSGLDFEAFENYSELSARRKRIAAGREEASEDEVEEINERLQEESREISQILNEVMVLRSRKHVKDQITEQDDIEISFKPPEVQPEEYELPPAYQPVYEQLPDLMDALHLPHITVKNPSAGDTLKALYKLNLMKRLESSTYAFVQSIETLYQSELTLKRYLDKFKDEIQISEVIGDGSEDNETLQDFVESGEQVEDIIDTLEEFGFDTEGVRADEGDGGSSELEVTVGEVLDFVDEDLVMLARFLSIFIGDVAENSAELSDAAVKVRSWMDEVGVSGLPDPPEEPNERVYPGKDLSEAYDYTLEFYERVFQIDEFRDPKIDRLVDVFDRRDGKVLVFTQYRATAHYLHETLVQHPESPLTEENSAVVVGGDENKHDVIRRFAPEASGYQRQLEESGETELEYVVATDTLSEGVNLQDIPSVVNYDLPWNPMRIVQRVGRVDRIGNTDDKYVHNFYPDGDIEAAIRLLKRLQAKINDIALIVGKENNILDPNENDVLERAGVETEKTIGEIQVEEIETSLRRSREVRDYNELDDTSKNPLLRDAGSDEGEAFERILLRNQLFDEYDLDPEDFSFAEDYFETPPGQRELLRTCYEYFDGTRRPGVFGLAHVWYEDEDSNPPLGRTENIVFHKPFDGEIEEADKIRSYGITPDVEGASMADGDRTHEAFEVLEERVEGRQEEFEEAQVEGAFKQGAKKSKTQEMLLEYLGALHSRQGLDRAGELREELKSVELKNTDEDRVLRERFRDDDRAISEWDTDEFLDAVEDFLDEYIGDSTEYQSTLAGSSAVQAELMCWGVIR